MTKRSPQGVTSFKQADIMARQKAVIRLKSTINGESSVYKYIGEYEKKGDGHIIVYTDKNDEEMTFTSIQLADGCMLLHREGSISADMLFDVRKDTHTRYNAWKMNIEMVIHTLRYDLIEEDSLITVILDYSLNRQSLYSLRSPIS